MVTVDLAAHSVVSRMFPDAEVSIYSLGRGLKPAYAPGETTHGYKELTEHSAEFLASNAYLYWGDFIHSCAYWELDMKRSNATMLQVSESTRLEMMKKQDEARSKLIFLEGLSDQQMKKAVIFGGTIITNEAGDARYPVYVKQSKRFFQNAGAVLFRDALSSAMVSPLRNDDVTLGCDCALTLEEQDVNQLHGYSSSAQRQGIGVFIGRSKNKLKMLAFSHKVGRILNERCHWIPWFSCNPKVRLAGKVFGYNVPTDCTSPGSILAMLGSCKLVVTDTYHVCINAWRMGIPAICIGSGCSVADSSIADKKKEIAYEMYGARSLYVYLEHLGNHRSRSREAVRAAGGAIDDAITATVVSNIQNHRQIAMKRLKAAISTALAID